jgi:hypothetical protein
MKIDAILPLGAFGAEFWIGLGVAIVVLIAAAAFLLMTFYRKV